MLMDQHGADHHMTSAETITMTETILDSQRQVHSEHGMMEASFDQRYTLFSNLTEKHEII